MNSLDLIKVSGLWEEKDKNGETYLRGNLSPFVKVLIFKNHRKTDDKSPDYFLYFSQIQKKPENTDKPNPEDSTEIK